ncbi:MAG: CCA-adding enzyme [Phycisphaerae bacterium]|nr:CCA-adding enzyme [Phycisphaerae bacterium]
MKPTRLTTRDAARQIVDRLTGAGYEALFAGGCVRDLLCGLEPKDYDIATSATPSQILEIYPHALRVGVHFGVAIVRRGGQSVEVATFRSDGEYQDGRHPREVHFTSAREDAQRRDFTINGMFFDPRSEQVIDYVGGQADLQARLIRAIGEPPQRFREDHLRLLRAVRFAARLQFEIEPATWAAIRESAPQIRTISAERIREELEKILNHSQRARGWRLLVDSGLLTFLWSEAAELIPEAGYRARLLETAAEELDFIASWALLLHDQRAEKVELATRQLRFSNQQRRDALWLIHNLHRLLAGEIQTLADLKLLLSHPRATMLWKIWRSYLTAMQHSTHPYEALMQQAAAIKPADITPEPLINGHDLIDMGMRTGPHIAPLLARLYYRQLNGEFASREAVREAVKQIMALRRE